MEKTRLTLVGDLPQPPQKLGEAGLSLWRRIQAEYQIVDVGSVELLVQACLAADRLAEVGAAIEHTGVSVIVRGVPRENPLLKVELAARAFIVKTLRALGIVDESIQAIGRPAQGFGWKPER
jgi:hypothetical protein